MTGKRVATRLIRGFLVAALAPSFGLGGRDGRADRIVLRGGGQIRGKVLADPARPGRVSVLTETGKTPLVLEKARIVEVVPEASPLDDYLARRGKAGSSAESQYELGLWCEKQKLPGLAAIHYEAALKYDKAFAPAHQKLGHVLYADRWLTQDELREAQGLVKYKGRWVTKEEKELREARAATTAEQTGWVRRLRKLRESLVFGNEERQRSADAALREIKDPIAVRPLVAVFGNDPGPLRTLLDTLLGNISGPEAARALAARLLVESDAEVRQGTMGELVRREEPVVVPQLVKALKSENPAVVNRAAWGLGNLNAVEAVPKLIPALFTTQYRVVMDEGGGSGGGIGASFASANPVAGMGAGPPIAYNGSTVAYMIPPAVGPGAVAYGATQSPALPSALLPNVGGMSAGRGPIPKLVPVTFQNAEVLAALNKLTGQDFGYDVEHWKRWVRTSFQPDPTPARRVPQP